MNPNRFKALYQGDEVYFIKDETYRNGIPLDAIVYTLTEAQILAKRSDWTRKMVHEAKKLAGAKVVPQPGLPLEQG